MGLPKSIDYKQCIYGLKGTDGEIKYIGHARYAAERLALHKLRARKGDFNHLPVYEWMNLVGPENVKVEIIEKFTEDIPLDTVCEREKYWISQYRDVTEMTNLSDGGFSVHGPSIKRGREHPRYGVTLTDDHKAALKKGRQTFLDSMDETQKAEWQERISVKAKAAWEIMPEERKQAILNKGIKGQQMWLASTSKDEIHAVKSKGPHVRYHVNGEKPNPACMHCINENLV